MSDNRAPNHDSHPASAAQVRALEERIAELEEKLEALGRRHVELGERLLHLSLATQPDPRFPFWTWYIRHHMPEETRLRLGMLLTLLSIRAKGEDIPEPLRKDIEGVPHEVLNGPAPLTVEDVSVAVTAVTGLHHEPQVVELFEALKGQGIHESLCDFYLAHHPEDRAMNESP